jgi:zinc protease
MKPELSALRRRLAGLFLLAAIALAGFVPAEAAIKIQRVVSPAGIEAWLVEDHRVPLLALDMVFRGGSALDPAGKEGLGELTAALLNEGAGNIRATAFQKELADKSITLAFGSDLDGVAGSLKTLTQYRDRAFELLALSLVEPRFDADAVERNRNEMLSQLQSNLGNPNWVARRKLMETVYAGHPYARPPGGTEASLHAIGADDMRRFVKARFGRDQLLVTVAGDITPAELGPALDRIFGRLPAQAAPFTIPQAVAQAAGETVTLRRPIPQTIIAMAGQGLERKDPDWYAGQTLNYALGGGGFNSRLMEDVRGAGSKRGLSYGVYSSLVPFKHGGLVEAGGATKNETAGETLSVIKGEFGRTHAEGITEAELGDAKTYITGSLPLSETSTDRLAALLMQIRNQELGIDYLERRDGLINGVTIEDERRVAQRILDPAKLTTILIGAPEGLNAAPARASPTSAGAAMPAPATGTAGSTR